MIVEFFVGSNLNQFLRFLIAFTILFIGDTIYYLSIGSRWILNNNVKIQYPILCYLILYLIASTLFGIVQFFPTDENITELSKEDLYTFVAQESSAFGLLTSIFLYVPLLCFVYYKGKPILISFMDLCFAIVIFTFSCLFTHLIAVERNLYN